MICPGDVSGSTSRVDAGVTHADTSKVWITLSRSLTRMEHACVSSLPIGDVRIWNVRCGQIIGIQADGAAVEYHAIFNHIVKIISTVRGGGYVLQAQRFVADTSSIKGYVSSIPIRVVAGDFGLPEKVERVGRIRPDHDLLVRQKIVAQAGLGFQRVVPETDPCRRRPIVPPRFETGWSIVVGVRTVVCGRA